jgi:hypothetical protein
MYSQLPTVPQISDVSTTPAKTAKRRAQYLFTGQTKIKQTVLKKSKKSRYEVFRSKTLQKAPIYKDYQLVILKKDASDRRNMKFKKHNTEMTFTAAVATAAGKDCPEIVQENHLCA